MNVGPGPVLESREADSSTGSRVQSAGTERAESSEPAADATAASLENTNPDETNVWPDAEAEAAFLAEARERGEPATAAGRQEEEPEPEPSRGELPPLDELVNRIPAEARELLDELFRARFVAVRRVKKADLKRVDG